MTTLDKVNLCLNICCTLCILMHIQFTFMKKLIVILLVSFFTMHSYAQISSFPYQENFDSITAPNLPQGWASSQNTPGTNDFVAATGTVSGNTVKSAPQAVSTTNPRINKFLITPRFNFTTKVVNNLQFWDRRSSAGFDADVVVEVSTDSISFAVVAGPFNWEGTAAFILRTVQLDDSLSGKESVWFRWRVIGSAAGTTGTTYRIDEIQLTVKKAIDLAATSIAISPPAPRNDENLIATVGITNKALAGNFSFTVQLFDSLALISSASVGSLPLLANETTSVQINYSAIKAGRHPLTAKIILSGDEDTTNDSVSVIVNTGYRVRTILINEILYSPPNGMPEWVECVNNSNDTIPISGWKISDAGTTKAAVAPSNRMIMPRSYFIITTDTAAFKNFFTVLAPLFQASFSALNNTGDAVVLFDQTNSVIDSLTFTSLWGGSSGGKSLERIDTAAASTLQSNWKTSVHPLGATPGVINSVTQKEFDAAVTQISVSPLFPVTGNAVSISSVIKNIGKQPASSITFRLYLDANKDSILTANEIQYQQAIASLNANDSLIIIANLSSLSQGTHWLSAKVDYGQDADTANNILFYVVTVGIPPQSIVINEMMYAPTGDIPEWVEFYNNTSQPIVINGWKISDVGTTKSLISNSTDPIPPQTYFIVTADSSFSVFYPEAVPVFVSKFSTLNNTTPDAVVLFDERNAVIDSVYYRQSWGGTNGMSLQRFDAGGVSSDSANWRSALPTPGLLNAVARKEFDAAIRRVTVSPLSVIVNQAISVTAVVANVGKQPMNNITVEFYLDANNDSIPALNELQFQQIISSISVSDSTVITAECTPEQPGQQRLFVKIISSSDEDATNNVRMTPLAVGVLPQSIVVTEIMYAPLADIPEWIECYNTTMQPVSINGWKISDAGTTKTVITNSSMPIAPQSYCIIAADTSFNSYYVTAAPVFISKFSTLNNTTPDAVVLFDNQNRMIDSVYYKQSWGGINGHSLQRFDIFSASSDSANWRSALPSAGIENSVARKDFDIAVHSISSAKSANGTRITAIILNQGRQTADNLAVKFFHDANADSITQSNELIYSTAVATIAPMDSAIVSFDWEHSLQGKQEVIALAEYTQDQRTSNNSGFITATNSFLPQTFVINEIMYEPLSGNAEFVELLNRSSDTIDVSGWRLMDQPSSSGSRAVIQLSQTPLHVPPNNFLLVSSDSAIFTQFSSLMGKNILINSSLSLSNSGEDIVLVDLTDTHIDSVRYSPSWHIKNFTSAGRSLERINPNTSSSDSRNWSSSVAKAGASPLQSNSIFIGSVALSSSLSLTPNPFSPDNDGHQDFLSINFSLPTNSSTIRVRIYDVTGRLIRRLAQSEPASSAGSLIWNGLDDDGQRVRIGMYIILFEALDNFGGVVKAMKDVAVVARKL